MNKNRTKSPILQKNIKSKWQGQRSRTNRTHQQTSISKNHINVQMPSIIQLAQNFNKKVKSIIEMQQSLDDRSLPQRCPIHNSTYSLYSQTQRNLICPNCIYQKQKKKNIIIPINHALPQLKQNINKDKVKIKTIVDKANHYIKTCQQNLQRVQIQYPQYILKLERHYTNLHEILLKKQKQHINQIRYLKDKVRYQSAAFNTELNNILSFITQKLQQKYKIDDKIVLQHQIFNTISQFDNFFKIQLPNTIDSSIISPQLFAHSAQYLIKNLQLKIPNLQNQQSPKKQGIQQNSLKLVSNRKIKSNNSKIKQNKKQQMEYIKKQKLQSNSNAKKIKSKQIEDLQVFKKNNSYLKKITKNQTSKKQLSLIEKSPNRHNYSSKIQTNRYNQSFKKSTSRSKGNFRKSPSKQVAKNKDQDYQNPYKVFLNKKKQQIANLTKNINKQKNLKTQN